MDPVYIVDGLFWLSGFKSQLSSNISLFFSYIIGIWIVSKYMWLKDKNSV